MRINPKIPVIQNSFLRTVTTKDILDTFFVALASEISLTALMLSPKLVEAETKSKVDVNSPDIPTPSVPKNKATNLDLTTLITILIICTPPNNEVAFNILE